MTERTDGVSGQRMTELDNVKWILTLLIVMYHISYISGCNAKGLILYVKDLGDSVTPAFAIISGWLFFRNTESFSVILRKMKSRILTLLVPYLLWNIFHAVFVNFRELRRFSLKLLKIDWINDVIFWGATPQFWYIFMLIFWTALAPVLWYAYRHKWALALLLLSQIVYLILVGGEVKHSNFIYILYTWAGYLGYRIPELVYKIVGYLKRHRLMSVFAGIVYFGIWFIYGDRGISMGIAVWLYALRALSAVFFFIGLPQLKLGKKTGYRFSFWLFAIHYYPDMYIPRHVYVHTGRGVWYQMISWITVVAVGVMGGMLLERILPRLFNLLVGSRGELRRKKA